MTRCAAAAAEHQAAADALREKAESERDAAVQRSLAEKAADDALRAQAAAENRSKVPRRAPGGPYSRRLWGGSAHVPENRNSRL